MRARVLTTVAVHGGDEVLDGEAERSLAESSSWAASSPTITSLDGFGVEDFDGLRKLEAEQTHDSPSFFCTFLSSLAC